MSDATTTPTEWDTVPRMILASREARCTCGATMPSDTVGLAFFEYMGPGSKYAAEHCGVCRYRELAHQIDRKPDPYRKHPLDDGHAFQPDAGRDQDSFYCGCRGWD